MIASWREINERFDAIKDHKPKASKKLEELGEILASAFLLDADRANDMWQYIIDLNVADDIKNAKYYIAQVYKKLTGKLSAEDAAIFVSMEPERVRQMFLYGYDSANLYLCLNSMIEGFVKLDNIDNAITVFDYFAEKFGGIDTEAKEIGKGLIGASENLICLVREDPKYKNNVTEFFCRLEDFNDEQITSCARIMTVMMNADETTKEDLDEAINACIDWKFSSEFMELIHYFKNDLEADEIRAYLEAYCSTLENEEIAPRHRSYLLEDSTGKDEINNEEVKYIADIIMTSEVLLDKYFDGSRFYSFCREIIKMWVRNENWDLLALYLSRLISGASEERTVKDLHWDLLPYRNKRIYYEYEDVLCDGIEYKNLIDEHTDQFEKFVDTLAKVSAMSVGAPYHNVYHEDLKGFVEREFGNVDILNKYGFDDVFKLPSEKIFDCLESVSQEGRIVTRNDRTDLSSYYYEAQSEYREHGANFVYELALNEKMSYILCNNFCAEADTKSDMLKECILHGNNDRAVEIIDLMIATLNNPITDDKQNKNPWEGELLDTVINLIRETERSYKPFTPEMINSIVSIVKGVIPHLCPSASIKLKAELLGILDDPTEEEAFVKYIRAEINIDTTHPASRGFGSKWVSRQFCEELRSAISLFSKKGRIDILSEILQTLYAVKGERKDFSFSSWISTITYAASGEACAKLMKNNPVIFCGWLEDADDYTILVWARKLGQYSKADFDEFAALVTNIRGQVPGLEECFREEPKEDEL